MKNDIYFIYMKSKARTSAFGKDGESYRRPMCSLENVPTKIK